MMTRSPDRLGPRPPLISHLRTYARIGDAHQQLVRKLGISGIGYNKPGMVGVRGITYSPPSLVEMKEQK